MVDQKDKVTEVNVDQVVSLLYKQFYQWKLDGMLEVVNVYEQEDRLMAEARLRSYTGANYSIQVPIYFRNGELMEPSVFMLQTTDKPGKMYLWSESAFKSLLDQGNLNEVYRGNWNKGGWQDYEEPFVRVNMNIFGRKKIADGMYYDPIVQEGLRLAMNQKRWVRFYYWAAVGTSAIRVVAPHYLWRAKNENVYLIGWDNEREDWRSYNLGRIYDLQIKLLGYFKNLQIFMQIYQSVKEKHKKMPIFFADTFEPFGPFYPRSIRLKRGEKYRYMVKFGHYPETGTVAVSDLQAALNVAWRILKQDGKFVFNDLDHLDYERTYYEDTIRVGLEAVKKALELGRVDLVKVVKGEPMEDFNQLNLFGGSFGKESNKSNEKVSKEKKAEFIKDFNQLNLFEESFKKKWVKPTIEIVR
jgi:hypothetical protein